MIEEVPRNPDARQRRALLEVLAHAFRDNPMNMEIHGASPGKRVRANRAGLRSLVLDAGPKIETRVILHEGAVVGGFIATPPSLRILPAPKLTRQIGCFIHQGAEAMDRWGQVNQSLGVLRPAVDHWYLSVLGVAPERQGLGFGGRLLAALFEIERAHPAPIYLESDREASVRFYRGHGFEMQTDAHVHGVLCCGLGRGFG